jgi:ribonuclease BN (tRNA processing enzyme)
MEDAAMGDIELAFLGSGDAFGSGARLQACLQLRGGPAEMLLDCGATSLVALKRAGIDPGGVGHVVVSHLHGDHFGGIPFLILDGQFSRRELPLVIAGPPDIEGRVHEAMEVLFPGSANTHRRFTVEFIELVERSPTSVGPAVVTAYPVVHACGAPPYALVVDYAGKRIAYSGDTEWTQALVEAGRDADVLVCEAYFFEKKIKYHLDYATLRAHRDQLGAGRLVLTHMSRDMLDRRDEVDVLCADDGLVLTI